MSKRKVAVWFESHIDEEHDGVTYRILVADQLFAEIKSFADMYVTTNRHVLPEYVRPMRLLCAAWQEFESRGDWSDFGFVYEY